MPQINPDHLEFLVGHLVATDTLWSPFRHDGHNLRLASAIEQRRAVYASRGLPILGGGGMASRQEHSRLIAAMRDAGELVINGRPRLCARLTDWADDHLRTMTACYRVDESRRLLQTVDRLAREGIEQAGFVLESAIIGRDYDRLKSADLVGLENKALPLLARGYLHSASDVEGRLGYAISDEGRRALRDGIRKPKGLPKYDRTCGDRYDELWAAALAEREAWTPEETSHVVIPLSCGLWP